VAPSTVVTICFKPCEGGGDRLAILSSLLTAGFEMRAFYSQVPDPTIPKMRLSGADVFAYLYSGSAADLVRSSPADDAQDDWTGSLSYAEAPRGSRQGGVVTFRPDLPLQPATHYRVTVNRNNGMWSSLRSGGDQARLNGSLRWDFFTEVLSLACSLAALHIQIMRSSC